ncbi:interleukin-10 receptor subunit alpha [Stigmatopora argus]
MMTSVQVPGIAMSNKTLVIVFLFILNSSTGFSLPRLDRLSVNILDGEVIVFWKPAQNATSDVQYNVQMTKLAGEWAVVVSCSGITKTFCNLSGHIHRYASGYKVRVQTVDGNDTSEWTVKKFLPNASDLQPPSFTLYATSSTITIHVHQKPIHRQLFPFGVTYILHLKEIAKNDKAPVKETTVVYLTDDLDQESKTFSSLQWGVKYCVSVMVEGNGALSRSDFSPEQCLLLPEREWFVLSVSSLSVLGLMAVAAVSAIGLVCYLKRPAKTPVALKSPMLNWNPLSVGDGPMEVVTDKGWFLSGHGTQVRNFTEILQIKLAFDLAEENHRRPSQDSGVIVVCNAVEKTQTGLRGRQEDSGCGSMGETVYPQNDPIPTRTKDVVLSEPSVPFKDVEDYRRQNPALHVPQDQIPSSPVLAQVVSGYRAGPPPCICPGAAHFSKRVVPEGETIQWRGGKEDFGQDTRRTRVEMTAAFPLLTSLTQELE